MFSLFKAPSLVRRIGQPGPLHLSSKAALLTLLLTPAISLVAQTGGEAGIQGTVLDQTGAVIPGAVVTATNTASGVTTTRTASSDGLYTISPILPGVYTVTVAAKGFQQAKQNNLNVDALKLTGLNVTLQIGDQNTEVTVESAPPALETTNATLGAVMENQTYSNLPLQQSGQQRDPTAFAVLTPGVVGGARAPIIGGTGNYLAAVYIDGIPVTTINQNGDNRVVSNALPVESIDQFQVITSSPDAEYQGAGLINFSLKSGTDKYHGSLATYVRARAFDAWSYASKDATCPTTSGAIVQCGKPDEHQSEYVASGGGHIPLTKKRGFFYLTYDKYHGRAGINPNFLTIPTARMRTGDFGELTTPIYNPLTDATCVGTTCRTQFTGNVIPTQYLSPTALKMQAALPTNYANTSTVNNYFGGVPSGFDNWEIAGRADFDLTSKQRLSYVIAYGVRKNVPFTVGTNATAAGVVLPLPYTAGGIATITPVITDIEHAWQISDHITNQLKFAFNRFGQPITSLTDGVVGDRAAADFGITGLPAGQAQTEFPGVAFTANTGNPTALASWTSNGASGATQTTVPNTYTLLDNFLVTKGKHSFTIGFTTQWLQDNVAAQLGPSSIYQLAFSANSTAPIVNGTISTTSAGFSYASFLLGAASQNTTLTEQAVSETGGRYHDISPYAEDVWKVTPKLTVNIGLRWDYFPPFHEVQDRWSFLNPNLQNAITGNMGELQFAGNHGGAGVSCGCRTPVNTWWKNYGPRVGLAYSVTPTTVVRAGYALVYSIGGGVGGRGGAGTGTGQTGFNIAAPSPTEITQTSAGAPGPSYYLNNGAFFTGAGIANTQYGGPGYALPTLPAQNATSQTLLTSYFGSTGSTGAGPGYADPYLSGRAPEFNMFNGGIQQALTKDLTLTVNYAGTQSHFLLGGGSNPRGYFADQLNPKYYVALAGVADSTGKNSLLGALATPANVQLAKNALPGYGLPYNAISSPTTKATIAQTLVAFPQYNGVSDTWGQNVANISYNSLQVSLAQRASHGLSYTFNYTWSRNIGDDGTYRSGFDLPSGSVSGTNAAYHQNRIDRGLTTTDMTHNISAYGVWEIPGAKSGNRLVRGVTSGFQISTIYQFTSGTPFIPTYSGCQSPNAGTCELDINPNYTGTGKLAKGYRSFGTQYIDPNAFSAPTTYSTGFATNYNKVGNAPRTAPFGLRNPYFWKDDISLRRSFNLGTSRLKFVAEVDALNVANHATLSNPTTTWGAPGTAAGSAFGKITGAQANPRDFQFAGHLNF
ncbi:carboxypeptidase-like regulatory domain-containing protein [Granulicella tundricola]|uniref:TonB-dependent receptor plug n=1 Tax=Granulicella tundricola (strain ATCC BAA-1859 / DSM 23138 / MP5ACTX9) TaxID=1198114 RepID=E8X4E5_GRATM|nr:carboxypeptidase-like regulatory domain-containing protein [Granulicella tundricola]ADW68272.1 TonB-dependent receptor plug [Granulicella tundricola MP5ACTX9]